MNKARTQALNQIHKMLVTAPEDLRTRLRPLKRTDLLATCAVFRIDADDDSVQAMTRLPCASSRRRIRLLDQQLTRVSQRLHRITATVAPQLVAIKGVGPEVASTLLVTAGDDIPQRMHSEAAFGRRVRQQPDPGQQRQDPPTPAQPGR